MSSVETAQIEVRRIGARRRRSQLVVRAPWRRGSFSPEEVARALNARRDEFRRALGGRGDAMWVAAGLHGEIVDEAICAVVMSSREIVSEEHLLGAFWTAASLVLKEHRAGRRLVRLGSRERVDFELTAARMPAGGEPCDVVELSEQLARAADFMAVLSTFERRVVIAMAVGSCGVKLTARKLGVPVGTVRRAARSADAKLDQVAVIAAAGRMCSYRLPAIVAEASGVATEDQAEGAQAHVAACMPCRMVYVGLCREMRGREFQRAAVAAFLPLPTLSVGHVGAIGKFVVWIEQRINFLPRGSSERAAEVLGGAGIAKAAATGTAIVVAGTALTGHIVHTVAGTQVPSHHRRVHVVRQAPQSGNLATGWANRFSSLAAHSSRSSTEPSRTSTTARLRLPTPPSKSLSYLALGTPGSASRSSSGASNTSSPEPSGRVASVTSPSAKSEGPAVPTKSGGGTSLGYLGR
jgi:nitrate reductase NapE component